MKYFRIFIILMLFGCSGEENSESISDIVSPDEKVTRSPYVVVLGVAQDAGYPQIGCEKICCENVWNDISLQKYISCIAIVDPISNEQWIVDATPDIKYQMEDLQKISSIEGISGVLLTHAHIGHYTGLMHFGREVMGTKHLPVYSMPKMSKFLEGNGPWSQLVSLGNISLKKLQSDSIFGLNERISVNPFLVPHRDEFSETVGYKIIINDKSLIFIPDIDKWDRWDKDISEIISKVDYAFLDATFYKNGEIKRDMSEIPHPFVEESMHLFSNLSANDKKKIHFIHFNHTNPLLIEGSDAQKEVSDKVFNLAKEGQIILF